MTPGRLWWLVRRDFRRGWRAAYHDRFTLPRIARWELPAHLPPASPSAPPVHLLTGAGDWLLAGWMFASFARATGRAWRLVVHDDGTLPPAASAFFLRNLRAERVIARAAADAAMAPRLAAFPACAWYRAEHPLALKVFDIPSLVEAPRFILLDSDLLFFRHPAEIVQWADDPADRRCLFNADVAEGALLPAEEAAERFGVRLWERVNSGLCLLVREAVPIDFCERVLTETGIRAGHVWRIEQTLFALCASRHGEGGLLPPTYEVSLAKGARPDVVVRHYVGAVRDRFFAEGLHRLAPELLDRSA